MLYFLVNTALAFSPSSRTTLEPDVKPHNPATSSWLNVGTVPADLPVTLTVPLAIASEKRALLEKTLFDVSDPDSATYGQHLGHNELKALLAVPTEQVSRVQAFFAEGRSTLSPHGDVLTVTMRAGAVERALQTKLAFFEHSQQRSTRIIRASSTYSVPAPLAADVTMVGELLQFPRISAPPSIGGDDDAAAPNAADWPSSCTGCSANLLTPATLQSRYKIPAEAAPAQPKNTMAVAEFQGQFFKEKDLEKFSSSCSTPVDVQKVIGDNRSSAGVEAELDIEYIKAVAPGVPLTVIYDAGYSLLKWGQQLIGLDTPPLIASVSYGNDEAQQSGVAFMLSVNDVFMKAGAMGISILFASGDQGVCGREGCGVFKKKFNPDFPAGSPYVTAVGGTDFAQRSVVGAEKAWSNSGGGFSNTFAIPAYQADAVSHYKSTATLPPAYLYNDTGRGYPDVAALGGQVNPYCIVSRGLFAGVAGTSAASPVVGGVFARLNGLRLGAGKPPMGFLNPFIYKNPSGFQDVTLGTNNENHKYGFDAVAGWDPATGMGTPDFDALSKLV